MSIDENASLETLRTKFANQALSKKGVAEDPLDQFANWFAEAESAQVLNPDAMVLATAGSGGLPSARAVLLRGADSRGFRFFTNLDSRKARDIVARPRAALVFHWKELERQITVGGTVTRVDDEEAETYFHSRPYRNQIGAWTSRQSQIIEARSVLDKREAHLSKRFPEGSEVPVPEFWGGFIVRPTEIEFWQSRPAQLHDRIAYRRAAGNADKWEIVRLAP